MAETDQVMRMKVINREAEWDSSVDEASESRLMANRKYTVLSFRSEERTCTFG